MQSTNELTKLAQTNMYLHLIQKVSMTANSNSSKIFAPLS